MYRLSFRAFDLRFVRCCHSVGNKLEGSLHLRFLDYLKVKNVPLKIDSKLATKIRLLKEDPMKNRKYRCSEITQEISRSSSFTNSKPEDICSVLDVLIELMPEKVASLNIFINGTKTVYRKFEEHPTKETFTKLCFYLGLFKQKPPGPALLSELMEKHCDKILQQGVNTTEFAIICTATFKVSVRFASRTFTERLISEIYSTTEMDHHIFVAFIKSMRLNNINSPQVFEKLRELAIQGEFEKLDFKPLIHIFAYVAESSINDEKLSKVFIDRCVSAMDKTARTKDIQKLLYSCALLNISVDRDYLEKLNKLLIERTKHQEFQAKFDEFVDVALSMWMLGFKPRQLIEKLLKDSRIFAGGNPSRVKIDSRKKLLLTCLEIEEPEWISSLKIPSSSFDEQRPAHSYHFRPSLGILMTSMRNRKPKVVLQIKNLNIAGLLVEEGDQHIHIEALDSSNALSDESPNGILALKIRLLRHMGCQVSVVSDGLINFKLYFHRHPFLSQENLLSR